MATPNQDQNHWSTGHLPDDAPSQSETPPTSDFSASECLARDGVDHPLDSEPAQWSLARVLPSLHDAGLYLAYLEERM